MGGAANNQYKGGIPRDSPQNVYTRRMAEDPLQGVSWQEPYQGKPCYVAHCEIEVLIIKQDDNLQVADAVPRRRCELTEDDKKQLERLNISLSSEFDDASIMAARYALDKRHTDIRIERSRPGSELTKSKVLKMVRDVMKTSTKPAGKLQYFKEPHNNS